MVVHAMGAIEMALWDLCGKAVGAPVHALLGGATRDHIVPYASLQPAGTSYEAYRDALCASAAHHEIHALAGYRRTKWKIRNCEIRKELLKCARIYDGA